MHSEVTWRILLLGAVLVADLLVFLSLVADELREWHTDRTVAKGRISTKTLSSKEKTRVLGENAAKFFGAISPSIPDALTRAEDPIIHDRQNRSLAQINRQVLPAIHAGSLLQPPPS